MNAFTPADTLHRLIKEAIDSGAASSLAEAEKLFCGYRLCLVIGESDVVQPAHQAALLTAVALGRRVFLGGVTVVGPLDTPLRVPLPLGASVAVAVRALGGRCAASAAKDDTPSIVIGSDPIQRRAVFCVRTVYSGWRGGVVPANAAFSTAEKNVMPLAPMLAASLAVSEAFFFVQGQSQVAGKRSVGFSLWQLSRTDWLSPDEHAPRLRYLPSSLWLIGLGHLGQAYLWALGLLPYPQPGLSLVLQDGDIITPSTESTSILSDAEMVGIKKTRAMAAWAQQRGFATTILERLFDASFSRREDEPAVALCGLDNALGRRALDRVGFPLVIEAGLGRGHRNFRTMRLHTLPGSRTAAEIWKTASAEEDPTHRAAYRKMLDEGALDRCGVTLLAGKAVGAPFVGSIAACLVIGEVLRLLHGGVLHQLIDLDLQSIEHRNVVPQAKPLTGFNPGYVLTAD